MKELGLKFYAFSLHGGEDTRIPAEFYHRVFGWKIVSKQIGHSELQINDHVTVVFSRPTKGCAVSIGTLTFVTDSNIPEYLPEFQLETVDTANEKYKSFLDRWGNRLWVYRRMDCN